LETPYPVPRPPSGPAGGPHIGHRVCLRKRATLILV